MKTKNNNLEIYFRDLNESAKQKLLDFWGYENKEQANLGTIPITTLHKAGKKFEEVEK